MMEIFDIKKEMKQYRDMLGADLLDVSEVDNAKTKKQLAAIIDNHSNHLEMILTDAQSSLERFRKKLGLHNY